MVTQITEDTSERELAFQRVFDAPRDLVWAAWTVADQIGEWWGPDGFTTTTFEMEVRPGAVWRFIMHGPDGTDYPNLITYLEIDPPARLVYWHGDDANPQQFHVTATFEDEGGKTRLTMRSLFESREARDFVVEKHGAIKGAKQTLGRLADFLASRRRKR